MWVTRQRYVSGLVHGPGFAVKNVCVMTPPVSVLATYTPTQINTKHNTTGELNVILGSRLLPVAI